MSNIEDFCDDELIKANLDKNKSKDVIDKNNRDKLISYANR